PGATLAVLKTAPTPVMTPQPISAARSSGMSSRTFTIAFSCTNICSAKDDMLRNWWIGPVLFQVIRVDTPGGSLTSVLVQIAGRPDRHCSQVPQNTDGQVPTWSPFLTYVTPEPTSSTTPADSWPSTAGKGC